tara:strand:- start:217 stop:642 length:426 start_codon:yes stop_codon:yes gene_type:complete
MNIKNLPIDIQRKIYYLALSKYYYEHSTKLYQVPLWNELNNNYYYLYDDWNYIIVDKNLDLPLFNDKKDLLDYLKFSIFIYRHGINNYNYSFQFNTWSCTETFCFKIKKYYMYITEINTIDNTEYDLNLDTKLIKKYKYNV